MYRYSCVMAEGECMGAGGRGGGDEGGNEGLPDGGKWAGRWLACFLAWSRNERVAIEFFPEMSGSLAR